MSASNQTNAATPRNLQRRSKSEQNAHLTGCPGGCLRAIPPEFGEIVDYSPPKGTANPLSAHFVVALGPVLKENHSPLPTEPETEYYCCVVGIAQWLPNILDKC